MIERHHDYVIGSITQAAGTTQRYEIQVDSDAPFAMRQLLQARMNGFQLTIIDSDDRRYSQGMSQQIFDPNLNVGGNRMVSSPLYPQITYPPYSTISFDLTDLSGLGQSSGFLVFRGVKLYEEGRVLSPKYPPRFQGLNFRYVFKFTVNQGTVPTPGVLLAQPMGIQPDADFAFRMASMSYLPTDADAFDLAGVDCIIRDQYGKAFSNSWVPMQYIFPPGCVAPGSPTNRLWWPDVTVYPEIYLCKNTPLLIDIRRTTGTAPVHMNLCMHGMKVFPL